MHSQKHTQEHAETDRHTHTDKAVVLSGPVWPDHSKKGSPFSGTYKHMYMCAHTRKLKG